AALAKKAFNPVVMDLKGLSALTDYFLIVSGSSAKHVTAVAESVIEHARSMNILRLSAEGVREGNWALLDYGDVIVHVFRQSTREFYDLEGLWREAPRVAFSGELGKEILAAQQRVMEEDAYEYDDEDDE
ncbi:MAG: ribosome silencing factor, partial [Desulfomonilaceae bacterium]